MKPKVEIAQWKAEKCNRLWLLLETEAWPEGKEEEEEEEEMVEKWRSRSSCGIGPFRRLMTAKLSTAKQQPLTTKQASLKLVRLGALIFVLSLGLTLIDFIKITSPLSHTNRHSLAQTDH